MALSTINTSSISALGYGFKNRIINGAMVIDQRNAGAAVTYNGTNAGYTVDRFYVGVFGSTYSSPALTIQQVSDAPSNFTNSLKVTSSSTNTPDANKLGSFYSQSIEGFNIADLGWGTASAQSITVQFCVKASKTGTVSVSVENSARDRSYLTTITINAANTWETKTVTIPGDTSGTWLTTNGVGLDFKIGIMSNGSWLAGTGGSWLAGRAILSTSQTNFIAVSGDYITITGVQLEKGVVATAFDFRPYGTELALCQRYYQSYPGVGQGNRVLWSSYGATYNYVVWSFKTTMRTAPTVAGVTQGTVEVPSPEAVTAYSSGASYAAFGYNGSSYGQATASAEL